MAVQENSNNKLYISRYTYLVLKKVNYRYLVLDIWLQKSSFRYLVIDIQFQISSYRYLVTDIQLHISSHRYLVTDIQFQTHSYRYINIYIQIVLDIQFQTPLTQACKATADHRTWREAAKSCRAISQNANPDSHLPIFAAPMGGGQQVLDVPEESLAPPAMLPCWNSQSICPRPFTCHCY